jgi:hypothetical protein
MDADERRLLMDSITERIIWAAHPVSNTLGVGITSEPLYKFKETSAFIRVDRRFHKD